MCACWRAPRWLNGLRRTKPGVVRNQHHPASLARGRRRLSPLFDQLLSRPGSGTSVNWKPFSASAIILVRIQDWRKQQDGSARLAGNGLHLSPGSSSVRAEETSRTGKAGCERFGRIPPCAKRAEGYVRARNEKPGAGKRIDQGSDQQLLARNVQLRLFFLRL